MSTGNSTGEISPVNDNKFSDDESPNRRINPGIGLCLSGGGYRAMLFHVGTLWRLNEFKYLPKLSLISSVSGGSITSAVLGMNWSRLGFNGSNIATKFEEMVVLPIRKLASKTIDVKAGIGGILEWKETINDQIEEAYENNLFQKTKLQSLPDSPNFIINATNVQSGVLWRFSKSRMGDYRVGEVLNPDVTLAKAVAASSAFPPVLSPAKLQLNPNSFAPDTGKDLREDEYRSDIVLTDGGVYDNMGLETVFKDYETVLVSDAGAKIEPEEFPKKDWARHSYRVFDLVDNQVRSLRKRALIAAYKNQDPNIHRSGAYWGIRTDISNYGLSNHLDCPHIKTLDLAATPTRLKKLEDVTQERLINWGYAVCDAAMRKHVDQNLRPPTNFPYPDAGVG